MKKIADLAEVVKLAKPMAQVGRFRVLAGNDVLNMPPLQWLVRGVIPAQGLACIFGPSGSGKSFLTLDMAAAIADAWEKWFGLRVTTAPVFYCALEGEFGFRQRVMAWQTHKGRNLPAGLRFIMQPLDLRSAEDREALANAVTAAGGAGGLLIIDTLNRASPGADENSSRDMGEIIDGAKLLQLKLGGTVLLVHHTGKDPTKGPRGHTSLNNVIDAFVEVQRNGEHRQWSIYKEKDENDKATYPFRLEVVEVETDEYGDPITSCVVVTEDGKAEFRRVLPPKSGHQRAAWVALGEILRQAGNVRPANAPDRLPVGSFAVTLEAAIDGIRECLKCEPKRRTERTQQALNGLQSKGLVVIEGGCVWLA